MEHFLLLLIVVAAPCALVLTGPAADKPNILMISPDDFGRMDLGANNSQTFYERPTSTGRPHSPFRSRPSAVKSNFLAV